MLVTMIWRSLVFLLVVCAAANADVYRWVDGQGNVIFSDTPQPGAEKVEIKEPTIIAAPKRQPPTQPAEEPEQKAAPYESVLIESPADQETVRENTGKVTVQISLSPALQTEFGHTVQLFVDGKPARQPGQSTSATLADVVRGAHTLQAVVFDKDGLKVEQSKLTTFFMRRHSVQHPSPPPPPR